MPKKPGAIDIYDKNPWTQTPDLSTAFPNTAMAPTTYQKGAAPDPSLMGRPGGMDKTPGMNPFAGGMKGPGGGDWLRNLMMSLRQNPGMFGGQWGGGGQDTGWGGSNGMTQPWGGSPWGQFGYQGGPASPGYWQQQDQDINSQYRNYWDRNKSGANPTTMTTPNQTWMK